MAKQEHYREGYENITKLSKILSHPARVTILEMLIKEEGCVNDIVNRLPLSQSTVSQHIKELKDSGVLCITSVKNKNFYCINKSKLNELYTEFFYEMNRIMKGE